MKEPNATLAAVFRLLPVSVSGDDLKGASEQVRRGVPANFAAIALNGLCFPTAGRILGAGLLLTWFISDLTTSAFWVGLVVPINTGWRSWLSHSAPSGSQVNRAARVTTRRSRWCAQSCGARSASPLGF